MFAGRFEHNMDSKGRLTVPARFRDELEGGLVMCFAPSSVIRAYPRPLWDELSANLARMPQNDETVMRYTRVVYSSAYETALDKMGRILLPAFMRDYAHIERETIIIGANTYFEIWELAYWREMNEAEELAIPDIFRQMGDKEKK